MREYTWSGGDRFVRQYDDLNYHVNASANELADEFLRLAERNQKLNEENRRLRYGIILAIAGKISIDKLGDILG